MKNENKLFSASKLSDLERELNWDNYLSNPLNYLKLMTPSSNETVLYSPEQEAARYYTVAPESATGTVDPIIQGVIDIIKADPELSKTVRITSTVRPARYEGDHSNHISGMAFDIVPTDGDWGKLKAAIAKNTTLVSYLKKNNLGVLSEITPEEQARYKATGANIHIGPDSGAIAGLAQLLNEYGVEV